MSHPPDSVQPRLAASNKEKPAIEATSPELGQVFLVGAGPGAPGLITVRGAQCLALADVVLYDGLANPQLLDMAPQAECISVGKHGQTPIWTQEAINRRLVELAQAGKTVVRLKGGDPAVFARTAEELEILAASGISFEVVPGITAALAAASYVGIPITHRKHASAVAFITGQQQTTEPVQDIDWTSLARFPGTVVFYMGVTTVAQWTSRLLEAGKAADTPAAIVRRCTWSDQTVLRCRLDEVANRLTPASKMRPPVIVIVGAVASLGEDFEWFARRPLHGFGILVTRPQHQAEELTHHLRQLGADVYHQPTLAIHAPGDLTSLDSALAQLVAGREVQGVTFSSVNGVEYFMKRLAERGLDARVFAGCRLAAVGPTTAAALPRYGLQADVLPNASDNYSAASLIQALRSSVDGQHWIVTCNNRSRQTLAEGLRESGAAVTEALTYETQEVTELRPSIRSAIEAGRIQLCTVTSSAIARSTHQLLGPLREQLSPVSLSTQISQTLQQLGWPPWAEALQNSVDGLVQAIVGASKR